MRHRYPQAAQHQLELEQQHQRRAQTVVLRRGLKTLASVGVGYGFFMWLNGLDKYDETSNTTTTSLG